MCKKCFYTCVLGYLDECYLFFQIISLGKCAREYGYIDFINSFEREFNETIRFLWPQNVNDICDRIIAQIKIHINIYIKRGNAYLNAYDIKKAMI